MAASNQVSKSTLTSAQFEQPVTVQPTRTDVATTKQLASLPETQVPVTPAAKPKGLSPNKNGETYKFTVMTEDINGGITYHNFNIQVVASTNTKVNTTTAFTEKQSNFQADGYGTTHKEILNG